MARQDSEKCLLCSKLSTQEAQDRYARAIAAGMISAATTAVPNIGTTH